MLVIKGGKIITVTQGVIEKGLIFIDNGKIIHIYRDAKIPEEAKVIDVSGKVVMPGMIDAHCHIGIYEETIGWAGEDGNEATDPVTPHLRAVDAIKANADEGGLRKALESGITTVQILPGSANVIGGLGTVVKTAPKQSVDEMILREPSGLKIAFGENARRVYGFEQKKMPQTRMAIAGLLREWFTKGVNYMKKKEVAKKTKKPSEAPEKDLKLEAVERVLKKEIPLRAHAHRADDMLTAVRIAEEFNVDISLEHAIEGHRIVNILAKKKIPAVWGPYFMPKHKWEVRELSFETLKTFWKHGVKFAIMSDGLGQAVSFLPMTAILAVKYGLPKEEALKAITINAAEILGVEKRVGSLETGKDADLIILSDDPMKIESTVEMVFVNGEKVYEAN
jgi:imidazolonepropionase-like amidohydrolase